MNKQKFLSTKDAADRYCLSVNWFAKRRMEENGPPYLKLDGKVLYDADQVDDWFLKNYTYLGSKEND